MNPYIPQNEIDALLVRTVLQRFVNKAEISLNRSIPSFPDTKGTDTAKLEFTLRLNIDGQLITTTYKVGTINYHADDLGCTLSSEYTQTEQDLLKTINNYAKQ